MLRYQEDFSKYDDTKLDIYNIGWLSENFDHNIGYDGLPIISKLESILNRERVNLSRGIIVCPLCPRGENKIHVNIENNRLLLGISEIWIPNNANNKIFAAPDLVIHFIEKHNYNPPQEFINTVNDFDLASNWSGDRAYNDYLKAKYS